MLFIVENISIVFNLISMMRLCLPMVIMSMFRFMCISTCVIYVCHAIKYKYLHLVSFPHLNTSDITAVDYGINF